MKLGNITSKNGQSWITIHGQMQEYTVIHIINAEIEEIKESETTINIKVKK
jgi:outer membrane lipopolysaccharide assembly protein LptE/RlpB